MNTAARLLRTWWEQNTNDLICIALIAAGFLCTTVFVRG
jgi:predicted negative regulator of RcsB-dependent stress response